MSAARANHPSPVATPPTHPPQGHILHGGRRTADGGESEHEVALARTRANRDAQGEPRKQRPGRAIDNDVPPSHADGQGRVAWGREGRVEECGRRACSGSPGRQFARARRGIGGWAQVPRAGQGVGAVSKGGRGWGGGMGVVADAAPPRRGSRLRHRPTAHALSASADTTPTAVGSSPPSPGPPLWPPRWRRRPRLPRRRRRRTHQRCERARRGHTSLHGGRRGAGFAQSEGERGGTARSRSQTCHRHTPSPAPLPASGAATRSSPLTTRERGPR